MAATALDPYYYQSRMRELSGQKELTTGRGLTQSETEAILNAELNQRYTAELSRRQIANQERIQEEQLKQQEKQLKQQEDAAKSQSQAAMVSGVGQLALAGVSTYGMGAQAGWWGSTAATPAVTGATVTGAGAGAGTVAAGGITAAGGTGVASAAGGTGAGTTAGGGTGTAASGGGMGAASIVGLILASAVFAAGHTELARKDDTWYGSTVAAGSPWKDQKLGEWGGFLNVATAPFFPEMLTWGTIVNTGTGEKVLDEANRIGDKLGLPGF